MEWLYRKCMEWAGHRNSYLVLLLISFGNSSVFPVSPYYPLVAMCYAKPEHWLRYSLGSTIACIAGGVLGWLIGAWFWDLLSPYAYAWIPGLTPHLIESLRPNPGAGLFVAIVGLAFSPVPYKVVAVAAGIFHVPLPLFLAASFLGRAPRMLATGVVVAYGSQKCREYIERNLVIIGVAGAVITVVCLVYGRAWMHALSGKADHDSPPESAAVAPAAPSGATNGPSVAPASNAAASDPATSR